MLNHATDISHAGPENNLATKLLESEVCSELRRRGIVFWLDREKHYTGYVDNLVERQKKGDFPYPVVPFRGSFLEMMLALEELEGGLDQTPVLIHMPGFTEEMMRGTPLLELYKAGFRYRRALDTLIREAATRQKPPEAIDKYLAAGDYTLEKADGWLATAADQNSTGLKGLLDRTSIEVVVRELVIKDTFINQHLYKNEPEEVETLRAYFERQIGLSDNWIKFIKSDSAGTKVYNLLLEALKS